MTEMHLDAIPVDMPTAVQQFIDKVAAALRSIGRSVREMAASAGRAVRAFKHYILHASKPSARCPRCYPMANPASMGRRGTMYHARSRRRSRRH